MEPLTFDEQIDSAVAAFEAALSRLCPKGTREISISRTHLQTAALWAKDYGRRPASEPET